MTKIPEISLKNSKNKTTTSKEIYNACIMLLFSIIDHGTQYKFSKKVLKLSSDF